jgi:hypothetical protein
MGGGFNIYPGNRRSKGDSLGLKDGSDGHVIRKPGCMKLLLVVTEECADIRSHEDSRPRDIRNPLLVQAVVSGVERVARKCL